MTKTYHSLSITAALLAAITLPATAATEAVDLSSWLAEGQGTWQLQDSNTGVLQTVNGEPTVFHDNSGNSQGRQLSGTIKVRPTSDDDFIGFVLGYNAGDLTNADADYLLVDWKKADQTYNPYGGLGKAGLAISRVQGALDNTSAWTHSNNVTELQRATTLSATGWNDDQEYEFDLIFTSTSVAVKVNGLTELMINGSFADGSFGFYNFSQSDVKYAGIQEGEAPAVPLPASLPLLLSALVSLGLVSAKKRKAA